MNNTEKLLTGGNGIVGQSGLIVRQNIDDRFTAVMGELEYIASDFIWTTGNLAGFTNKTLIIKHTFSTATSFTLPANVTLQFEGGKLLITGTITGNNTSIVNNTNAHCFSSNTIFNGSWMNIKASPQWFGATCSPTANTTVAQGAVSSSAALQTLFNSPFGIHVPNGFYYIDTPITVSRRIYADFGGSWRDDLDVNPTDIAELNNERVPNHVRFYTDVDTDFFNLASTQIHLIGGTYDVRNVPMYTKDIFRVSINNHIFGMTIHAKVIGDLNRVAQEGYTGKVFHWDTSNPTITGGFLSTVELKLSVQNMGYGIYIDEIPVTTPSLGNWCGGIDFEGVLDGCKQAIVCKSGFHNRFSGYTQTRGCLAESQRNWYQIELWGSSAIDMFCWDLSKTASETRQWYDDGILVQTTGWYPGYGIYLHGGDMILENKGLRAKYHLDYDDEYYVWPAHKVTEVSKISILDQRWDRTNFISELHNAWIGIDKLYPITVNAFNAGELNLDDPSTYNDGISLGLTPIDYVSHEDVDNLFKSKGYCYRYSVASHINFDNHFVEIYFNGGVGGFSLGKVLLNAIAGSGFKKMQWIGIKKTTGEVVIQEWSNSSYVFYKEPKYSKEYSGDYVKFIIRVIGFNRKGESTYNGNLTISTGSKTLNIGVLKDLSSGDAIVLRHSDTEYMKGTVTSYNKAYNGTGEIILNITSIVGSGTFDTWTLWGDKTASFYFSDLASFNGQDNKNYIGKLEDYRYKFKGLITQSGTDVPTVTTILNTTPNNVTGEFVSVGTAGRYYIRCNDRLIANKTIPQDVTKPIYQGATFIGTVRIRRSNSSVFLVETYNDTGVLSNDILSNFEFEFEVGW